MGALLFSIFLIANSASAAIKVVTTTPDVMEIVKSIGQDQVEVQSLLSGSEDPHFAEARPDYILKVNRADVVCALGLDLEIGWLPKVLAKSGNAKIQTGGSGFCSLGRTVSAIDIPSGVIDRSMGDLHPHGNPHFNLDPLKLAEAGAEVVRVLSTIRPDQAGLFEKNYTKFKKSMEDLHAKISRAIKKNKVMEYHKEFSYFFKTYNLESMGSLEEKPGMPPSATRIAKVASLAKENKVSVLFATPSAPHKVLERFTELSGVRVAIVPSYIQPNKEAHSIESLQELLQKSLN